MKAADLDYALPPELIAQRPTVRRDQSRLLVYERTSGAVRHRRFDELPEELPEGTLTVVNDTRVLPARLRLEQADVERVTLHVGLDTFRPISADDLSQHELHSERYEVSEEAWARICDAPRVLAVGTTTVRVLESIARGAALRGRTDLFVTPGF